MSDWVGDLARGAAAGAVAGPIGMAVGGLVGLAGDLFGSTVPARVAPLVEAAALAITGTSGQGAHDALLTDPAAATAFRGKVAEIMAADAADQRRTELQVVAADAANTASARAMQVAAEQKASQWTVDAVIWWPMVIDALILGTFVATVGVLTLVGMPDPGPLRDLTTGVLGVELTLVTWVVGFWRGSSSGSARKTDLLAARSIPVPP